MTFSLPTASISNFLVGQEKSGFKLYNEIHRSIYGARCSIRVAAMTGQLPGCHDNKKSGLMGS